MTALARIFQINVAPTGGVPKGAVRTATVDMLGIAGNAVADAEKHGGPNAALCLYSLERIQALQAEGHPIFPGSAGENVTIAGLDWERIAPGTRLQLGRDVLIEVTRHTSPCYKIAASFAGGDYSRISQKSHEGWSRVYAKVLTGGAITVGEPVTIR